MGILNREIEEVELLPVARGIITRWWIVLVAALVGAVAMWLQESDLQTTPARTEVTRIYESRDETALLALVGIDPATVSPFPSFSHQIIQIQEPAFREAIAASTSLNVAVSVSRSEQRFSLLDTVEGDGKTKFTFLSVGTPTYTFFCEDASVADCNTVLDAYRDQLQLLRQKSIVSGLDRMQSMLESLSVNTDANTEKIQAIGAARTLINGELALLSSTAVDEGATVTTVKTTTYAFGFAGGALVGLLIALQLTLIDKRIRSLSQLARKFGAQSPLGHVTHHASQQHTAAAIVASAQQAGISSISLVPATASNSAISLAALLHTIAEPLGVSIHAQSDVSTSDAQSLLANNDGVVIVAQTKQTTFDDVQTTWSVYESAHKRVLGVVLAD